MKRVIFSNTIAVIDTIDLQLIFSPIFIIYIKITEFSQCILMPYCNKLMMLRFRWKQKWFSKCNGPLNLVKKCSVRVLAQHSNAAVTDLRM